MKIVTKDVLIDAANRLLFTMSDEQFDTLGEEFKALGILMKRIGDIQGLEEYEPMTFPFECSTDYLREDEPDEVLDRKTALKNAGSVKDNQIKLPKVVL